MHRRVQLFRRSTEVVKGGELTKDTREETLQRKQVLEQLARLAFGKAEDAMRLALQPQENDPKKLDLSAVSEFKVTEKGVEIKLVDRVKALETLYGLLEETEGQEGAETFYRALTEAAEKGAWEHD